MSDNLDTIQLINTAIIKSKEKKINQSYDERLQQIVKKPAIEAINRAITIHAEDQKISRDQSAIQIVETLRELDSIWGDFVMMEGITKLKELLRTN